MSVVWGRAAEPVTVIGKTMTRRRDSVIRQALPGVSLCLGLLILASFASALHPVADALAVFRGQMALCLMGCAVLLLRRGWVALPAAAVAVLAGGSVALPYLAQQDAGSLRLYQKNMLYKNDDLAGLEADIRAVAPDVLTLQEVSKANEAMLARLKNLLPHQIMCPYANVGGTAVASRLPIAEGVVARCGYGVAALPLQGPDGVVWAVSVHLSWPWPYRQQAHSQEILPVIAGLPGPKVVAGDFNMVPWAGMVQRFESVAQARLAGPAQNSLDVFSPIAPLAIDHVIAPGGGQTQLRPKLGSDHGGIVAQLSLVTGG